MLKYLHEAGYRSGTSLISGLIACSWCAGQLTFVRERRAARTRLTKYLPDSPAAQAGPRPQTCQRLRHSRAFNPGGLRQSNYLKLVISRQCHGLGLKLLKLTLTLTWRYYIVRLLSMPPVLAAEAVAIWNQPAEGMRLSLAPFLKVCFSSIYSQKRREASLTFGGDHTNSAASK